MPEPSGPSSSSQHNTGRIFFRLLSLLRPYWALITFGLILLFLSMPAELFPAFVWMYVVDFLIRHEPTGSSNLVHVLFSFGGRLSGWQHLLPSALGWLFAIYA